MMFDDLNPTFGPFNSYDRKIREIYGLSERVIDAFESIDTAIKLLELTKRREDLKVPMLDSKGDILRENYEDTIYSMDGMIKITVKAPVYIWSFKDSSYQYNFYLPLKSKYELEYPCKYVLRGFSGDKVIEDIYSEDELVNTLESILHRL